MREAKEEKIILEIEEEVKINDEVILEAGDKVEVLKEEDDYEFDYWFEETADDFMKLFKMKDPDEVAKQLIWALLPFIRKEDISGEVLGEMEKKLR